MSTEVEQKVDNLESVLQRFIVNTEKSIESLAEDRKRDKADYKAMYENHAKQNRIALNEHKEENRVALKQHKEENKVALEKYKDENRIALEKYKEENRIAHKKDKEKNRIALEKYKEENRIAHKKDKEKNRIALEKYKEENQTLLKEFRQTFNKQWGELANKMGTLIEDIFMPGVGPSVRRYFESEIDFIGTHVKKHIKKLDLKGEFDVVATDEDRVYVVDVKSSADKQKIDKFKGDVLSRFRKLFPEYDSKKLIPIIGSLRFDEDIIAYATENGVYAMGYREWEYLDLLNFDAMQSNNKIE